MVTNRLGNKNFVQPMKRLRGLSFSLLNLGRGGPTLFPQVLKMFSWGFESAPQVLNMVPKKFPVAPHFFFPFCLAIVQLSPTLVWTLCLMHRCVISTMFGSCFSFFLKLLSFLFFIFMCFLLYNKNKMFLFHFCIFVYLDASLKFGERRHTSFFFK
jgi:hypothetical protein